MALEHLSAAALCRVNAKLTSLSLLASQTDSSRQRKMCRRVDDSHCMSCENGDTISLFSRPCTIFLNTRVYQTLNIPTFAGHCQTMAFLCEFHRGDHIENPSLFWLLRPNISFFSDLPKSLEPCNCITSRRKIYSLLDQKIPSLAQSGQHLFSILPFSPFIFWSGRDTT